MIRNISLLASAAVMAAVLPPLRKDAGPAAGVDRFASFFPFTKVDAKQRIVVGPVGIEVADRSGEIMDYETSKVAFQKFADEQSAASGGKNFGNLRVMHTKTAAGLFPELFIFDDANKQILGKAHVVDDQAWALVEAGVLTGFSPGGGYAKRWADPAVPTLKRYTPTIQEISLVDRPCIPGATFEFTKADGVVETVQLGQRNALIKIGDADPIAIGLVESKARELAKAAGKEGADDWHDFIAPAEAELIKVVAPTVLVVPPAPDKPAPVVSAIAAQHGRDGVMQKWVARDGSTHDSKVEALARNTQIDAEATVKQRVAPLTELLAKVTTAVAAHEDKAPFTPEEFVAFAKAWKPNTEVPTRFTDAFVILRGTEPVEGITSPLVKVVQAVASGATWEMEMPKFAAVELTKAAPAAPDPKAAPGAAPLVKIVTAETMQKGLYQVSRLADLIMELKWLTDSVTSEAASEGDGSGNPAQLKTALATLCAGLRSMVIEETGELFDGGDLVLIAPILEAAAGAVDYRKFESLMTVVGETIVGTANGTLAKDATPAPLALAWPLLEKVGARNSAADKKRIQAIHDNSTGLGADCASGKAVEGGELEKVAAVNAELQKVVDGLVPQIEGLLKKVGELEKAPAMPRVAARAVDRTFDGLAAPAALEPAAIEAALAKMPEMERALLLTKVAQQSPMRVQA